MPLAQHILQRRVHRTPAKMGLLTLTLVCLAALTIVRPSFVPGSANAVFAREDVPAVLAAILREDGTSDSDAPLRRSVLHAYAGRAFAPLWFPAGRPTAQ